MAKNTPAAQPTTKLLEVKAVDLSCKLTDDERNHRAREAVTELDRLASTVERHKEAKARMKAEVSAHESKIDVLRAQASTGFETRPVTCHVIADYAAGVATTIRQDTGETIDRRSLDAHERQVSLLGDDGAESASKAFESGQAAAGRGAGDNPYPEGSDLAAEWDRGFRSVSPVVEPAPPDSVPGGVRVDDDTPPGRSEW